MVELVHMVREQPPFPGGPVTADVHPDEVENWRASGWVEAAQGTEGNTMPDADLSRMTVSELREYAKEHNVQIPATVTLKAEIISILQHKE